MHDIVKISGLVVDAVVAVTAEEQTRGLMFIKANPPIMAFPSDKPLVRKFWMKNTYVPLDIVFCNAGMVQSICTGKPLCLDTVGPNSESNLVVEFPKGYCEKNGITVGDLVELKCGMDTIAKKYKSKLERQGKQ